GLAVTGWDTDQFIDLLINRTSERMRFVGSRWMTGPEEECMRWLAAKPAEWHQRMYSLLYSELSPTSEFGRLRNATIVRLGDGSYRVGRECFFPSEGV